MIRPQQRAHDVYRTARTRFKDRSSRHRAPNQRPNDSLEYGWRDRRFQRLIRARTSSLKAIRAERGLLDLATLRLAQRLTGCPKHPRRRDPGL